MRKILIFAFLLICFTKASAQIRVSPTSVNINSQNPTTVFLTFGRIPAGYVPAEAVFCGELVPAPLILGTVTFGPQCRSDTIYGVLPSRYNLSRASGNGGFTDIVAIPASVVRRAYQDALNGGSASFLYVRRFTSTNREIPAARQVTSYTSESGGEPDQFVAVTFRMTGGGAGVPFALTNVELKTLKGEPILFVKTGEMFPKITAEIQYNGTGTLKGRWEIVQPGEESPGDRDLLTEATLPIEERGSQKRYTQIARFNHFLPPVGKFLLSLEMNERVPTLVEGQYILLLRIEATDDKESDSDLQVLGVGNGIVHSGAVASFPMPILKFFVTGKDVKTSWAENALITPNKELTVEMNQPLVFSWKELEGAAAYRLEILDEQDKLLLSAMLLSPVTNYRAPSWFWTRFAVKNPRWRVAALDASGKIFNQSKPQKILARR